MSKQLTIGGVMLLLTGCGGHADSAGGNDGGPDASSEAGQSPADADAAPSCGHVQPCGGDVVGDWTFTEVCNSAAHVAAIEADFAKNAEPTWCAIQRLVGIDPLASGSLRFDAAGTYVLDLAFGGTLDINYPASCLIGASCDETTTMLQDQIDAGTYPVPSVSSISCTGSSSCLCRATVNSPQSESGTYSISGSVVTLTAASGAVTNESFCIDGTALHLLGTSTGSSGQTTIDSDVIAMRAAAGSD